MFIGEKEVGSITGTTVNFADGSTKEYTAKQLEYIVTEELKDPTAFMEIVVSNVVAELYPTMEIADDMERAKAMLDILEKHDVSSIEMQYILNGLKNKIISDFADFLKEKVGKEMDDYKENLKKLDDSMKTIQDTREGAFFTACGKLFGTTNEGIIPADYLDAIRFSHITKNL